MKKLIRSIIRKRQIKKCNKRIKKLLKTILWHYSASCTFLYDATKIEYEVVVLRLQLHALKNEDVNKENVWSVITFLSKKDREEIFKRFV